MNIHIRKLFSLTTMIRKLFLAWLLSATIAYYVLPSNLKSLQALDALQQLWLPALLIMCLIFFCALCIIGYYKNTDMLERWLIVLIFGLLAFCSLKSTFNLPFLVLCLLILAALIWYAIRGWNHKDALSASTINTPHFFRILVGLIMVIFATFVSIWTVCRVYSFHSPTYDFGIFSQMFYNMKASGLPMTTVERDGLLSHFHVHVSPIYYLLLPLYCLAPTPATLQILQAVIVASAVIPLWKICQNHNLSSWSSLFICVLLLIYPAYSGGTSYDFHENAFLAPLILWLLFFIERRNNTGVFIFGLLTLLVKEDAAVYVAVIGLYVLICAGLTRSGSRTWGLYAGLSLLAGAVIYFFCVTHFLSTHGDGVMTYRYQNFMYDGSGSLLTVIKAVIMCPMKVLYECVDAEKLPFITYTLIPLLGLPLFTRKYQRYFLLIPYLLINLMSDYQYQHDIFFQYTFGSTALLFYLAVINISDLADSWNRILILLAALALSLGCFVNLIIPKASFYFSDFSVHTQHYAQVRDVLAEIPKNASVAASTFYTTHLSQREILYDVKYASIEHILDVEFVALDPNSKTSYKNFATEEDDGFKNLVVLLEDNGFAVWNQLDDAVVIYQKTS